jgi:uncharacterized repeat protein (TIGR02543 family)
MKFRVGTKIGDTLIEVMFAIGIFSLVAITIVSVMMSGSSNMQTSLETTMARNEIDAQAEALRFIHQAYISERNSKKPGIYTSMWERITQIAELNSNDSSGRDNGSPNNTDNTTAARLHVLYDYQPTTCSSLYDTNAVNGLTKLNAFIIDTQNIENGNAIIKIGEGNFTEATIYPRLFYTNNSGSEGVMTSHYTHLSGIEGIHIIGVKDHDTTTITKENTTDKGVGFYDFYIRTCWYGYGKSTPTTISTLIRLYDPDVEVENHDVMDYVVTFDWNGAECTNNATGETATCPVKKIQRSVANPEAFGAIVFDDIPAEGYSTVKQPMGWSDTSNEAKCGSSSLYKHGDTRTPYFYDDTGEVRPFVTYYAVWECEYTVTLLGGTGRNVVFNDPSNTNSGYKLGNTVNDDVEISVVTTSNSYNFALPLTTPTATNGYFAGWKCTRNCVGTDSSAPLHGVGDTIHFAQDESKRTFTAQWDPIRYYFKLVYHLNEGSGNFPEVTASETRTSHTFTISSTEPTRSGYKFLGWSKDNSNTVSFGGTSGNSSWAVSNSTAMSTAQFDLYAVWEVDTPAFSTYEIYASFSGDVDTYVRASNGMEVSFSSVRRFSNPWNMYTVEYLRKPYRDENDQVWNASDDGQIGSASETKQFPVYNDLDYVFYARRYDSSNEDGGINLYLTVKKDGVIVPGLNGQHFYLCSYLSVYGEIFRIHNGALTLSTNLNCSTDEKIP